MDSTVNRKKGTALLLSCIIIMSVRKVLINIVNSIEILTAVDDPWEIFSRICRMQSVFYHCKGINLQD